jgi:hypothetical protein
MAKLSEVHQTVEQLLSQLQASEHDRFVAHLYRSRREYRSACERAGKGGKQIERCVPLDFSGCRGAWDSKGSCGSGRSCCGLGIEPLTPSTLFLIANRNCEEELRRFRVRSKRP